jgi:uncharacterized Zn finger protein (UPF0148 family)
MSEDSAARIRSAASLLVKGGTLTNEPCPKCRGVQVRLADKTTCINCGNEVKAGAAAAAAAAAAIAQPPKAEEKAAPAPQAPSSPNLSSAASLIEEKIALLAAEIRSESDISLQKQKAELLESYLRILEKTKSLAASS